MVVGIDPDRVDQVATADDRRGAQLGAGEDQDRGRQLRKAIGEVHLFWRCLDPQRTPAGQQREVGEPEREVG